MAKKKITQEDLKDCSKCNEVREVNNELHCSLKMQDAKTPNSLSSVTFKDCTWFRTRVKYA